MNLCTLSDTSALVLLWSNEDCYPSFQSQIYLKQLSLDAGRTLYNKCNEIWRHYNEVIINRKTAILHLASSTIYKKNIQQVVILGAGLAPLDIELITRHKYDDIKVFSLDEENIHLKRKLIDNLKDFRFSSVYCIDVNINNIDQVSTKLLLNGYDKDKSSLVILEGISYYLSLSKIKDIFVFFNENSKNVNFIFEYLVPFDLIDESRVYIPKNVFQTIMNTCDLSTITKISSEDILTYLSPKIIQRLTMRDIEKMRTNKNSYFPNYNSGWIEICLI